MIHLSVKALVLAGSLLVPHIVHARCRNQPGNYGYPSATGWSTFNDSIDGRLINVVPSAKACIELDCTEAQWESGIFRQSIPGSMDYVGVIPLFRVLSYLSLVAVQLGTGDSYHHTLTSNPSPSAHRASISRQDYGPPPKLCLRNGTTCAQGDVPLYAVNATTVAHIQVHHPSSTLVTSLAHLF